ncbi:MAG: hypothetical protein IK021_01415, partial [Methanobrevibacter sp.]|nr:hypothetical protein [Methanobrevibacter sp.]
MNVKFEDYYTKKIDYSWSFTINGDSHDKIDINLHSDVSLGFKQNLSTTNAELGVLELLSKADADESNPDYEVNVSIDANESSLPSVSQSYNVDLNFELKNTNSRLDSDLGLVNSKNLLLSGSTLSSATWGVNEDLLSRIKYVQIGDILNKLNDMCYDLSSSTRKNPNSLLDGALDEFLDQRTDSIIDFSQMFDGILKYPPKTLQELMDRLNNKASVTINSGDYKLIIPFTLLSTNTAKVSLSNEFLEKSITDGQNTPNSYLQNNNLKVTDKKSLDYSNKSILTFNMELELTNSLTTFISDSSTLKSVLKYDSSNPQKTQVLSRLGKSNVVETDKNLNLLSSYAVSENIEISISDLTQSFKASVSKNTTKNDVIATSILAELQKIDSSAKMYCNEEMYAFESLVDIGVEVSSGNAREVGIYGKCSFVDTYVFDLVSGNQLYIGSDVYKVPTASSVRDVYKDFSLKIENILGREYKVIYVKNDLATSNDVLMIQKIPTGSNTFSIFKGGVVKKTLVVHRNESGNTFDLSSLPSTFKFTIDLLNDVYENGRVATKSIDLSFESSDFEQCYSVEDVANVINVKLANYSTSAYSTSATSINQAVFAEVVQEKDTSSLYISKLVFRCDNQVFEVTASEDVFGYDKGVTYSSTSNSIRLKFKSGNSYDVSLDGFLNDNLDDGSGNDLTISDLLVKIKERIKTLYSDDVFISTKTSSSGDTLSFFIDLDDIYDIGGFSLVNALGLAEFVKDGNLIDLSYADTGVDVTNVNLVMEDVVKGEDGLVAHANMGVLGLDFNGEQINFKALYGNTGSDWSDFIAGHKNWTYSSAIPASSNIIKVLLSDKIVGSKDCGVIQLIDTSTSQWDGSFSPSAVDIMSLLDKYGSDLNMAQFATDVAEGLQGFLQNNVLGNSNLKETLPLIGRTAPEALGIQAKVDELVSELKRNLPVTIQELSDRLSTSLGADVYFAVESDGIKVSVVWNKKLKNEKIAISSLSLGCKDVYIGGNAEAYLDSDIKLNLDMKVGSFKNSVGKLPVEFLSSSNVEYDLTLNGNPLKFDLSLSTSGISASLLKVVSTNEKCSSLNMKAHMKLDFNTSTKELESAIDDFRIGGKMYVELAGVDM